MAAELRTIDRDTAARLGELLAREGITLVYGGGGVGLMGVLANATLKGGGKAIGVIPGFLVRREGRLLATPLLLVIAVVETTDIVFAVDSIPAVFGVTRDTFIVFTSNIFAILGLRALYFLLAGLMVKFHYLGYGLGVVLAFVGAKMLLHPWFEIPTGWSLAIVLAVLALAIAASLLFPRSAADEPAGPSSSEV